MSSSLSTLADNLRDVLHKDKRKDCKSFLEYLIAKDSTLIFKCMECNKSYDKRFNKDLIKRFESSCKFCNGGINELCLKL